MQTPGGDTGAGSVYRTLRSRRGSGSMLGEINVTPLVDVVLVILVIMMVTAGFIVSRAIAVDLPRAASGQAVPRTLAITIDVTGQWFLDGRRVDEPAMRGRVRAARDADPNARAVIAADGRVAHARVVQVIDLLRTEGIDRFAINVQPEELQRR